MGFDKISIDAVCIICVCVCVLFLRRAKVHKAVSIVKEVLPDWCNLCVCVCTCLHGAWFHLSAECKSAKVTKEQTY